MQVTETEGKKFSAIQLAATLLLIGQSLYFEFLLTRVYVKSNQHGFLGPIVLLGVTTVAAGFFFYRFILRPYDPEKRVAFSYIFLKLWRVGLVPVGLFVAVLMTLRLLFRSRHPVEYIFLACWVVVHLLVLINTRDWLTILEKREAYSMVNDRIKRARFLAGHQHGPGSAGPASRLIQMTLANIHWYFAVIFLFLSLGIGFLVVSVAVFVSGNVNPLVVVPLTFGLALPIGCASAFLNGIEVILGRQITPAFLRPPEEKKAARERRHSAQKATGDVFLCALLLLAIAVFFMLFFLYFLMDEDVTIGTYLGLLLATFLFNAGYALVHIFLSDESKSAFFKKGIIAAGYLYGYAVLLGGLFLISELAGHRFVMRVGAALTLPWLQVLWAWLVLSSLVSYHERSITSLPPGLERPLLMRFTQIIAFPFQRFPALHLWSSMLQVLDAVLRVFEPLAGIIVRKRVRCPFDHAHALAISLANHRDMNAYLFGISTGGEGISFKDRQADEWNLSYYLPEQGKRLDIRVLKNRAKARRGRDYPGRPPAEIPAESVNINSVLARVEELLLDDLVAIETDDLTASLFFPLIEFVAEAPALGPRELPETPGWSVSVFDASLEPIQHYYLDAERLEVIH